MCRFMISLILLCVVGCKSFDSTIMEYDDGCWLENDGFRGVPVTVKVATHLKVSIYEIDLITLDQNGRPMVLGSKKPIRSVVTEIVETDKLVFVEAKRPAAGTIDLMVKYQSDSQQLKQVTNIIEDETLLKSTALLGALAPGLKGLATAADGADAKSLAGQVTEQRSLMAERLFDLSASNLRTEISDFTAIYVN